MKTITINDELWGYLSKRKIDLKLKSINNTIENLKEKIEKIEKKI